MKSKNQLIARLVTLAVSLFVSLSITGISYAYFANQISGGSAAKSSNLAVGTWTPPQGQVSGIRFSFNGNTTNTMGWSKTGNSYINGGSIALIYGETFNNNVSDIFGRTTVTNITASLVIANTVSGNANRNVTLKMSGLLKNGKVSTNAVQTLSTYIDANQKTLTFNLTVPTSEEVSGLRLQYISDDYNYSWYYVSLFSISVSFIYNTASSTNNATTPALAFSTYVNTMPDKWNTNATQVGDMITYHDTLDATYLNDFNTSNSSTIKSARTKYNDIRQLYASTYPL